MGSLNGSKGVGYWNESQLDDYMNHNSTVMTVFDNGVFPKIVFFIILIGLLGNIITILYVTFTKQLHTPTFLAICSLAITDFLICMISLIVLLAGKNDFFHRHLLVVSYILHFIAMIKSSCDVVFLFSLRYVLIVHQLKCKQYLTNSLVISASLTLWVYTFIVFVLVQLIGYFIQNTNMSEYEKYSIGTTVSMLIITLLPVTIILVLHCLKMRKLRSTTVNTAVTRRMSFIIIIFVVLNMVFGILFNFVTENDIHVFGLMHSINPFIFFIFHVPFRKCVITLLLIRNRG